MTTSTPRNLTPAMRGHADRLRWHWATREADSGLRSSHAALVEMIRTGSTPQGRASYDGGMVARCDAKKIAQAAHRQLESALALLTSGDRGVLFVAYGPHVLLNAPPLAWMGDAGPVAALSPAGGKAFLAAVARLEKKQPAKARALGDRGLWPWLMGRSRDAHRTLLDAVEADARGMLRTAHEAFEEALVAGGEARRKRKARGPVTRRVQAETFGPVWA
jgi:hypothetical protein